MAIVYQVVHGSWSISSPFPRRVSGWAIACIRIPAGNPVAALGWYGRSSCRLVSRPARPIRSPRCSCCPNSRTGCCRGKRSCTGEFEEIAAVYLVLIVFFHCDRTEIINGYLGDKAASDSSVHHMAFHINGTERTRRTKVLACSASDTAFGVDYWYLDGGFVFRV